MQYNSTFSLLKKNVNNEDKIRLFHLLLTLNENHPVGIKKLLQIREICLEMQVTKMDYIFIILNILGSSLVRVKRSTERKFGAQTSEWDTVSQWKGNILYKKSAEELSTTGRQLSPERWRWRRGVRGEIMWPERY